MQKTYCDFCAAPVTEHRTIVEVVSIPLRGTQHDFIVKRPAGLSDLDLCEPCRVRALAKIGEILADKYGVPLTNSEFDAAVEFAKSLDCPVLSTGPGRDYLEWRLNDRDRALLALLRKEMTSHRAIRIPIP